MFAIIGYRNRSALKQTLLYRMKFVKDVPGHAVTNQICSVLTPASAIGSARLERRPMWCEKKHQVLSTTSAGREPKKSERRSGRSA